MSEAYSSRGVSATKDEVHSAISKQDKGVFPGAFCKLIEDPCGDKDYCAAMHADQDQMLQIRENYCCACSLIFLRTMALHVSLS